MGEVAMLENPLGSETGTDLLASSWPSPACPGQDGGCSGVSWQRSMRRWWSRFSIKAPAGVFAIQAADQGARAEPAAAELGEEQGGQNAATRH